MPRCETCQEPTLPKNRWMCNLCKRSLCPACFGSEFVGQEPLTCRECRMKLAVCYECGTETLEGCFCLRCCKLFCTECFTKGQYCKRCQSILQIVTIEARDLYSGRSVKLYLTPRAEYDGYNGTILRIDEAEKILLEAEDAVTIMKALLEHL